MTSHSRNHFGSWPTMLWNISTKKPADSLFKPLTGYKKVDNMMTVMGMGIVPIIIQ